uniref:Uncharacterized protein n=1 Tax=Rhizophora mucronata TaxID=61149 RepID=A0A2P2N8J4_RHIMU
MSRGPDGIISLLNFFCKNWAAFIYKKLKMKPFLGRQSKTRRS